MLNYQHHIHIGYEYRISEKEITLKVIYKV